MERKEGIMSEPVRKTLKEIAAEAGVSIGTVHRAIYGKPGLGEKTRKRILDIVDAANYRVNEIASMMKRGTSRIAVVLPAPLREERFFFRGVWRGVRDEAEALSRYKLTFDFVEAPYRLEKIADALKDLYDGNSGEIDGLITVADTPEAEEWISRFSRRGVPVILVASYERNAQCLASVKADHAVCGRLAADFFTFALSGKSGRVLFLAGQADSHSNQVYARGFAERMREKLPRYELIRMDGIGRASIAARLRDTLAGERLQGVFSCNARNTYVLCELLAALPPGERPVAVGSDVFEEIAGYFDNGVLAATIYQSHREQGREAVRLMYEHLSGNPPPEEALSLPVFLAMQSNYRYFIS